MSMKEVAQARRQGSSIWDPVLVRRAIRESFPKLDPRLMVKNPVMFVVEIGSVITTIVLIEGILGILAVNIGFVLQVTLWLWFTVLFANFAEAIAEARGKAQADTLRKTKGDSMANRLLAKGKIEVVPASKL